MQPERGKVCTLTPILARAPLVHLQPRALCLQRRDALPRGLRARWRDVVARGRLQLRARGRQRRLCRCRLRERRGAVDGKARY